MDFNEAIRSFQGIISVIVLISSLLGGLIGWFTKRALTDNRTTTILDSHGKRLDDIEHNCKTRASRDGDTAVSSYKLSQAMEQLEKINDTFTEATQRLDSKITGITLIITESIQVASDAKTSATAAHKRLDDQQKILQNIQNNISDIKILLASKTGGRS